jgi:hypothetical protein
MKTLIPKIKPNAHESLKANVLSSIKTKNKKSSLQFVSYAIAASVIIVAIVILPLIILPSTSSILNAQDLLTESITKTKDVKTLSVKYLMRNPTPLNYNPDIIKMDSKLNAIYVTISFEQPHLWRIENKNKWIFYDGEKTYLYSGISDGYNVGVMPDSTFPNFTGRINNIFFEPQKILENIQNLAKDKNAKLDLQQNENILTLTLHYKVSSIDSVRFMTGDLFGWYNNKPKFITDCKQIYTFDNTTKLLKSFDISLLYKNNYITVLKSESMEYNIGIDESKITAIPDGVKQASVFYYIHDGVMINKASTKE